MAMLGQDVTIEPYRGVAAGGAEDYDTAVSVQAIVEETDHVSRETTPTGDQAVMAVLRCALDTDCPSGSRVTLASGRIGTATKVQRWDGGTSPAPSHLQITVEGTTTA